VLKVLIVEDSPHIQRRLVDMLAVAPEVQIVGCVDNAAQALERADALRPNVVVLDVALRDGDRGFTVLRELTRTLPQSQIIILSNFSWGAMRESFLQAGARAYFDKAFEFRKARDWIFEQAARQARAAGTD
jgi:DNA-binding NarL/FixJ family response regulator